MGDWESAVATRPYGEPGSLPLPSNTCCWRPKISPIPLTNVGSFRPSGPSLHSRFVQNGRSETSSTYLWPTHRAPASERPRWQTNNASLEWPHLSIYGRRRDLYEGSRRGTEYVDPTTVSIDRVF